MEWIRCKDELPAIPANALGSKEYLTCDSSGIIQILRWTDGWNCCFDSNGNICREHEINDIVAWAELPSPITIEGGDKVTKYVKEEIKEFLNDYEHKRKEKKKNNRRGNTYTIEIAETHTHYDDNGKAYPVHRVKGFRSLFLDDYALKILLKQEKERQNDE